MQKYAEWIWNKRVNCFWNYNLNLLLQTHCTTFQIRIVNGNFYKIIFVSKNICFMLHKLTLNFNQKIYKYKFASYTFV